LKIAIERFLVPDDKVPWNVQFNEYKTINYTASKFFEAYKMVDGKKVLIHIPSYAVIFFLRFLIKFLIKHFEIFKIRSL
jgi:hypothetical protein